MVIISVEGTCYVFHLIYILGLVECRMFMESCKRLRIMKRSEAKDTGLSPERDFLKGACLKDQ